MSETDKLTIYEAYCNFCLPVSKENFFQKYDTDEKLKSLLTEIPKSLKYQQAIEAIDLINEALSQIVETIVESVAGISDALDPIKPYLDELKDE